MRYGRYRGGYHRRYKNQQSRKNFACGIIVLVCATIGAAAAGIPGGCAGLFVGGMISAYICSGDITH